MSVSAMHSRSHVNIPVFIPHLGCPNMCVFCNQRTISGVKQFIPEEAAATIDTVLADCEKRGIVPEIAFFGGSFTGIERGLMTDLLNLAQIYIDDGRVSGIRMSTRPDYIDEEIIGILKHYTVSAVELGIQSFSDSVLKASKRGHDSSQSEKALTMLKESGFETVGQMMIGLPGATVEDEVRCAEMICRAGASGSRIYPTIVFRDTELYNMTISGMYSPLSVEEAVTRSAAVLDIFSSNGVECIRIGLCDSENLHSSDSYYAGPNHPAMGELVCGEVYYRRIRASLEKVSGIERNDLCTVNIASGRISQAVGQNRRNINRLKSEYGCRFRFREEENLGAFEVNLSWEKKQK